MLIFAYLMSMNKIFKIKIRLLRILDTSSNMKDAHDEMQVLLDESRMKAEIKIIITEDSSINDIIISNSSYSDMVMIGLSFNSDDNGDFLKNYAIYNNSFKNLAIIKSREHAGILD